LQFRYPRGQSRDSIAAGYARTLSGLSLHGAPPPPVASGPAPPAPPLVAPVTGATTVARVSYGRAVTPVVGTWMTAVDRGQLVLALPPAQRAAAPGALTSELVANGRRVMRFTPAIGLADTMYYAVGRFRLETTHAGRLTIRAWRVESQDTAVMRLTDSMV